MPSYGASHGVLVSRRCGYAQLLLWPGLPKAALPQNPNVEGVLKQDVFQALQDASRGTKKGGYNKGADSFKILEKLDPAKVRSASTHADRIITVLST